MFSPLVTTTRAGRDGAASEARACGGKARMSRDGGRRHRQQPRQAGALGGRALARGGPPAAGWAAPAPRRRRRPCSGRGCRSSPPSGRCRPRCGRARCPRTHGRRTATRRRRAPRAGASPAAAPGGAPVARRRGGRRSGAGAGGGGHAASVPAAGRAVVNDVHSLNVVQVTASVRAARRRPRRASLHPRPWRTSCHLLGKHATGPVPEDCTASATRCTRRSAAPTATTSTTTPTARWCATASATCGTRCCG